MERIEGTEDGMQGSRIDTARLQAIAVIIPWFGKELKGGAEQLAWQVVTRLAERGYRVEVLTTCCRSFQDDWATNHLEAGVSQEAGVTIRRFPVDGRDRAAFERVNTRMLSLSPDSCKPGVSPVSEEEAATFVNENIGSQALLEYLDSSQNVYEYFLFLPYLYGPILQGLPLVANQALLQPCLHDEVYAYLPAVEQLFRQAKGLLFNSEGEAALAYRLYGPGIVERSLVVGSGVESDSLLPLSFRPGGPFTIAGVFQPQQERFALYLGRRDATKNIDLLLAAYRSFKHAHPRSQLRLVVAGPGSDNVLDHWGGAAGAIDLGLVDEATKGLLLQHCLALLQPSRNESYSRTIMEAWFAGRPAAAHSECLATAMAVESAGGGWLAATEGEWAELFATLDQASPHTLAEYGARGQQYAQHYANWDTVMSRYEGVFAGEQKPKPHQFAVRVKRRMPAIHQLLPSIAYGDAISNHALWLRKSVLHLGYRSEIFAQHRDPRLAHAVQLFHPDVLRPQAGLLYHHSIGSEVTPTALAHPGPKCLIYHNITPARFFTEDLPELALLVGRGRQELPELAGYFPCSVGVSAYNAAELKQRGFAQPCVLPISIDPRKWNIEADTELMAQLQDGRTNILFVGRFVPNKRQEDLVEAFAQYLTLEPDARLILAGPIEGGEPYYERVTSLIARWGLGAHVRITGLVNDHQLLAYYRTAHMFWSMSEHEGFCVPIVEAMWCDVPVLAYKSSAIPETLAGAGLLFTHKQDLLQLAGVAHRLVRDMKLRRTVLAAQRTRRQAFLPEAVHPKLTRLIAQMEATREAVQAGKEEHETQA